MLLHFISTQRARKRTQERAQETNVHEGAKSFGNLTYDFPNIFRRFHLLLCLYDILPIIHFVNHEIQTLRSAILSSMEYFIKRLRREFLQKVRLVFQRPGSERSTCATRRQVCYSISRLNLQGGIERKQNKEQ